MSKPFTELDGPLSARDLLAGLGKVSAQILGEHQALDALRESIVAPLNLRASDWLKREIARQNRQASKLAARLFPSIPPGVDPSCLIPRRRP